MRGHRLLPRPRRPSAAGCAVAALCILCIVCRQRDDAAYPQQGDLGHTFAGLHFGQFGVETPREWDAVADSVARMAVMTDVCFTPGSYCCDFYEGWRFRIGQATVTAAGYRADHILLCVAVHLASDGAALGAADREALVRAGFVTREGSTFGDSRVQVQARHGAPYHAAGCCQGIGELYYYLKPDLFSLDPSRICTACCGESAVNSPETIDYYPYEGLGFGYSSAATTGEAVQLATVYVFVHPEATSVGPESWGHAKRARVGAALPGK